MDTSAVEYTSLIIISMVPRTVSEYFLTMMP